MRFLRFFSPCIMCWLTVVRRPGNGLVIFFWSGKASAPTITWGTGPSVQHLVVVVLTGNSKSSWKKAFPRFECVNISPLLEPTSMAMNFSFASTSPLVLGEPLRILPCNCNIANLHFLHFLAISSLHVYHQWFLGSVGNGCIHLQFLSGLR